MTILWIMWPVYAALVLAVYWWVGKATTKNRGGADYTGSAFGILVDDRGRYSLTRLQVSLWTLVVLSLTAAVFTARATERGIDPMGFTIPAEVLGLLGISVGSAVIATGVKAYKNRARPLFVSASMPGQATLAQMLMVEEGPQADQIADVSKLQNFLITIFLAGAYVVLAVHTYAGSGPGEPITSPAGIASLPTFSATFLTLLAISHAGYLGGKLPNRGEDPAADQPRMPLTRMNLREKASWTQPGTPTEELAAAAATARIKAEEEQAAAQRKAEEEQAAAQRKAAE
jgi:hypothetical protein